jgi:hypothetical protein
MTASSQVSDLHSKVMQRLWLRMSEIYGHRWTSSAGETPSELWEKALAGVAPEAIGRTIERLILEADPWPPTLPQFRAMCFDVPTMDAVRAELLRRDSSQRSRFALAVWRRMDGYAWRHAEASRADAMLRDAYEAARAAVMAGEPLPEPLPEIEREPEPPRPAGPSEAGRQALAALMAGMGLDRGAHA